MSLIEVRAAKKRFNTNGNAFYALNGVDANIEEGEFVAITGESGSGKSTLISLIGGIAPPSEGDVIIDTIPLYSLPIEKLADLRREYIGFVFQQFHLIAYLTASENVMLPLAIADLNNNEKRDLAMAALSQVGLQDKASNIPSRMSGGEQQRVAIARALVNEPPIIIADEPTGNLDTRTGKEIFKLFEKLQTSGKTIIMVTHNPGLASRTDRTISMQDGIVVSGVDSSERVALCV